MQHLKYLLTILIFIFNLNCFSQDTIAGLEISSDYYKKTKSRISVSLETFTDNKNHFSISIPKGWLITEDALPNIHGVSASDTSKKESFEILGVTEIKNAKLSLYEFFKKDIEHYVPSGYYNISKIGQAKIGGYNSYWVFSSDGETPEGMNYSVTHYLKKENSDLIYLISLDLYNPDDFTQKISNYREILKSFKIK